MGLPSYWRARDSEEIAELYVRELAEGIAGTGGIRAGAIKAATGVEVTEAEWRGLTGAALAAARDRVAIITHTENSSTATSSRTSSPPAARTCRGC